jgi:hypothetical protein
MQIGNELATGEKPRKTYYLIEKDRHKSENISRDRPAEL